MTKINSKLMIDYDDNNSYLDFITEKGIEYHIKSTIKYHIKSTIKYRIKSTEECRNSYIITFIIKDTVKPVSIQQKYDDNVIKIWEYSEELAESLGIAIEVIQTCFALTLKSKYWLAIDTIEEEIKKYIKNEYEASRISYKEYDRKLDVEYEDDDITHTIENIEYMIEKEYGENATLAEIKEDSEYNYNLLIASTYLRTKHKL
jgi:hypothetical protein